MTPGVNSLGVSFAFQGRPMPQNSTQQSVEQLRVQVVHQLQQAWVHNRFQRVARTLKRGALQASSAPPPDLDEFALIETKSEGRRFLDYYGDQGLETALKRYGLLDDFRESGLRSLELELDINDERHAVTTTALRDGQTERELIVQLLMRRDVLLPDETLPGLDRTYEVLVIDWLLLQHPGRSFSAHRSRLPGQAHPGVGMGIKVTELFARMASRLKLDGVITTGEYFHNAFMYEPRFLYFSPCEHGVFRALRRKLMRDEGLSLAQASWAIRRGFVSDGLTGQTWAWRGAVQILPRTRSLREYFKTEAYAERSLQSSKEQDVRLDREGFEAFWAETFAQDPGWLGPGGVAGD